MAAATAQGTYIGPMAALAATGQLPHLNGMPPNTVVPPTSGKPYFNRVKLTGKRSLKTGSANLLAFSGSIEQKNSKHTEASK